MFSKELINMKLSKELLKNLALLSNLGLIIISHILIAIALYKVIEKLIGFNSFLFVIFIELIVRSSPLFSVAPALITMLL